MTQWQRIAEQKFKYRKRIKVAVDEARAKKPYGLRDELKPNPTQEEALKYATPLKSVVIKIKGRRRQDLTISQPEEWLEIVDATYALYHSIPSGEMLRAYYENYDTYPRRPEALSGLKGISRSTFYMWRAEFLSDAVLLAAQKGLLKKI